jgi:hypothetical protein
MLEKSQNLSLPLDDKQCKETAATVSARSKNNTSMGVAIIATFGQECMECRLLHLLEIFFQKEAVG